MNQVAYKSEIEKGLWFLSPQISNNYLHHAIKALDRPAPSLLSPKEIEAGFVRDVLDPYGNVIDVTQHDIPEGSIGVVRGIGSMYKYGGWFNWGTDELVAMAQAFDNNPNIIGQIWHDDSGGGSVPSVAPWLNFLKNKKKPVVSLLDTSASANYYKNSGTDFVFAENNVSAVFGSIGIMLTVYNYVKNMEAQGFVEYIIEADQSEDKNKSWKLALEGKFEAIKKEMLNPLAIKFQDDIKKFRPHLKDAPGVLTGKMFYAEEALSIGLIDGIGNMDAAIEKVKFLAGARSFISTNY